MSIATQITALQADKSAIKNAITSRGGTVAEGDGFDDFANDIQTIPSAVTPDYLCFTGLENGCTLSFNFGDSYGANTEIYTSRDKATWTRYTLGAELSFGLNERVYFKGTAPTTFYYPRFFGSGEMSVSGNPMLMIDDTGSLTDDWTHFPNGAQCEQYDFQYMFWNMTDLIHAENLALTATTLTEKCYYCMFCACDNLEDAPALPATTLTTQCYWGMFANCSSLYSAPELPATTLANQCYLGMFSHCRELRVAPTVLPALTAAEGCYKEMFYGCEKISSSPELPAATLAESCYELMFYGCDIGAAPALRATTLAKRCYKEMFSGCLSLVKLPALPATTLAESCYEEMFYGCVSLTVGISSAYGEFEWSVPEIGTGTAATNAVEDMLLGVSGNAPGTPSINTTYYTPYAPVSKTILITANGTYDVSQKNSAVVNVPSTPMQSKTLTLGSASPLVVTPDSGYALSSVTPTIDSSVIKAENIAQGATILGVAGTHSGGGGGGSSIYKFFLQDGTTEIPMSNWNIAGLANAYYYTKNGGAQQRVGGRIFHINSDLAEGTADKFYVYNNTSGIVSEKNWGGEEEYFGTLSINLGYGKSNTATCVASGLASESGTIYDWVTNTVNANSVGGCNDWYIGSCMEIDLLRASGVEEEFLDNIWSSSEDLDAGENLAQMWNGTCGYWFTTTKTDEFPDMYCCFAMRSF